MYSQTVKTLAALNGLSQSDIARAAGVTRQRVSQWWNNNSETGFVNIQANHLLAIAKTLNVKVDVLLKPLPPSHDQETLLLWDKLYPDIPSLLVAALGKKNDALARIVHVYGLYASAKLFGAYVWRQFPRYKIFIHPARRAELEHLWQYRQFQMKH